MQRNMADLMANGKSLRTFGFGVTEFQINNHFKLFKQDDWKDGDILAKLRECGFPCIDRNAPPSASNEGRLISIKPGDHRRVKSNDQQQSAGRADGGASSPDGGNVSSP